MTPSFESLVQVDHNIVVVSGTVIVQVRNGPLTLDVLNRIEQIVQLTRARSTTSIVWIIVLEPGAPPVSGPLRERQREAIQTLMSSKRIYIFAVLLGSDVFATLQRTLARGLAKLSPRIHVASSVQEAARWAVKAVPDLAFQEAQVCALVERARTLLKERDPLAPLSSRKVVK